MYPTWNPFHPRRLRASTPLGQYEIKRLAFDLREAPESVPQKRPPRPRFAPTQAPQQRNQNQESLTIGGQEFGRAGESKCRGGILPCERGAWN
jgi:hypothetical protein